MIPVLIRNALLKVTIANVIRCFAATKSIASLLILPIPVVVGDIREILFVSLQPRLLGNVHS
jgi:hypothetical protein